MDVSLVKKEPVEPHEPTSPPKDCGSDLVSTIKCEDYQLMESDHSIPPYSDVTSIPNLVEKSPAANDKFQCPECHRLCPSTNALRLHRRKKHQQPPPVVRPQYHCIQCDKTFSLQKKLKSHQKYHELEQCPVCDKNVISGYMKEHIAGHEGTIRCEHCEKTFSSYRGLQQHRNLVHASDASSTEEQKCPECGQVFANTTQLNCHKRTHLQEQCPICKQMRSKAFIKEHIASHRGAFRCNVCDGTFCSKSGLKRHMETAHQPDKTTTIKGQEVGKYNCAKCNRSFDSERKFKVHSFAHKRVPCTICGKNITQKNYKAHLALHAYRSYKAA